MRLAADELGNLLRAHAYLQTHRPPILWDLETSSLDAFVRALGELIAAGLVRNGNDLGSLVLAMANVQIDPSASDPMPPGDLIAVSVSGAGQWADARWARGDRSFVTPDLPAALDAAGAAYAYSRRLGDDTGSVMVLYRRADPPAGEPTAAG
jgi:hypothetical protein